MKCESFRNRLLALPSPAAPTADLLAHLSTCDGCRVFAARAAKLDGLIASLPVPSSAAAKGTFLEHLTALGPVIQVKPQRYRDDPHSGTFRPFRAVANRVRWQHLAGLAAAVLLAVGVWAAWPGPRPAAVEVAGPRHELLKAETKHFAALAKADTADRRLRVWADWAGDVEAGTKDVYKAASAEDISALARMFDRTVNDGVLKQAKQLPKLLPADERQSALRDAQRKLGSAAADLERLTADAPPANKPGLTRMAKQARAAQTELDDLANGKGG